ncbi:MAG: PTS system mannose/fructose/sorbose family transporter subunit IID [Erysipelotrichaceae bacterium]|nr:PTS system mannose/fructose/sorbose family transporter subunit IID [Erysipelotrichaceae bacterium]
MMEKKLSKMDRLLVAWRTTFLQGSWNFERMQNGGWAYAIIPAIKKLYTDKQQQSDALKRHLLFFNTHPYVASPIMGVALAMEEEKANRKTVTDEEIQTVKVGMMGPLAGVGDPVFWFTLRPILAALGATLAMTGNILGPIIFFVGWNVIRFGFMWFTQEQAYHAGRNIEQVFSDGFLQMVTKGSSIIGLFVLGALVQRWVIVDYASLGLQTQLDALFPGLSALLLTLVCMWLLKKKVSPVWLIIIVFIFGILGHCIGVF